MWAVAVSLPVKILNVQFLMYADKKMVAAFSEI